MTTKPADALPAGYRLHEYRIFEVLGHGSFGITYLARDTSLRTDVAIKEYMPIELSLRDSDGQTVGPRSTSDQADYNWGLERFLAEAQTLARFQHPNIVPVYRFFEDNGTAYMVMAYQQGQSLGEILNRAGPFDEATLSTILFPLLDGLEEVHKAGILHRDIKPGNIFIRTDGTPVLLDFGSARQATMHGGSATAVVTPGYAPIEQYTTKGNQGPWTDIYGMGAVCYRALTGVAPGDAPDRIIHDETVPAAEAAADRASPAFLEAVDTALITDHNFRPESVASWRRMFGGQITVARASDRITEPTRKRAQSRRMAGFAIAASVMLLLGGSGIAVWSGIQSHETGATQLAEARAKIATERQELERRSGELEAARRRAEEAAAEHREAGEAAEAERKAAEAARRKAELAAVESRRAELAAKRKVEEEAKARAAAEQVAKDKAEAAEEAGARARAEAEARQEAEEKIAAERAAKEAAEQQAAEEAARRAEIEEQRKAEEEARKAAEAEAREAEEKAAAEAEAARKAEEARRKADAETTGGQVASAPPATLPPTGLPTVTTKAWLGVRVEDITPRMAFVLGLKEPRGAMVAAIAPRGPAAEAGLAAGDVILEIGGRDVAGAASVAGLIEPLIVGEPVRISVWRGEKAHRITVRLGGRPAREAARYAASGFEIALGRTGGSAFPEFGFVAAPISPDLRDQWGIGERVTGPIVMQVSPNGQAAVQGISTGDAILSADSVAIERPEDLAGHLEKARREGRGQIVLRIYRHGRERLFAMDVSK